MTMAKYGMMFCAFLLLSIVNIKCIQQQAPEKSIPKPNIILILADDLGVGDLGCYNSELIKTPFLDKMANEGIRFTQFYAGSTVCAPSRSVLMTGMHTGHTYIRGNKTVLPEGQEPLADSVLTFVEVLQQAGYATGAFGKWGLGPVGTAGDPNNQGFDVFYGNNCQVRAHRYYPEHLWHNQQKIILKGNNLRDTVIYAPGRIHKEALAFMEKNRQSPFFMFLPYTLPHAELIVPDDSVYNDYKARFDKDKPYKGGKGADYGMQADLGGYTSQQYPRATYAAMVTRLDRYVGEVMAKLKELGLEKNTLVIFASDNGPSREGGSDPDFFNSNGPFRGYKRDLYEGGIRSPLIAWWPGKIKAGTTSDHIAAMWDLFPTFTELIAKKAPENTDGISLLPALLGESGQTAHKYLYWEFHEQGGKQAIRKQNWKAVRLNVKEDPDGPIELYNLENDPMEMDNVAQQRPEIVKEMKKLMKTSRTPSEIFPFITD